MMNLNRISTIEFPKDLIFNFKEMVYIKNPCFIYGNTGKTIFIRSVYSDTIFIDSREILEIKNLGGFYAVKDNELVYTEGILVDAMRNGRKICFKNIDLNLNMLYYLRPVIDGKSFIASNGQVIVPNENFRIFFTCKEIISVRNVAFIGPIEFKYTQVLESFGNKRQPVEEALELLKNHRNDCCSRDKGFDCDGICLKEDFNCSCDEIICSKHFRMLCELRDTLNFLSEDFNSNSFRVALNQSLINIFLKHESKILSEHLYITVPILSLPNMLFAKTNAVESALRSLILNIKLRKPTLLVGETGAGKTAIIQYLCSNSDYFFGMKTSLKIINMSADFDSSDLIGGYQSIDFNKKISEIYHKAKLEMPKSIQKRALLEFLVEKLKVSKMYELLEEASLLLKLFDKKVPFFYKEGILTNALRNGEWILFDEINLASEETLNLIESVLSKDVLVLYENGDFTAVKVHPNFMIFACMNPHGDFGKKKYDTVVFNKIVFYDFSYRLGCIKAVVQSITRNCILEDEKIANFYFEFKANIGKKEFTNIIEPLVSGRTLCRALNLILQFKSDKNIIYKAFNLLFFTQLDFSSRALALKLFKKHFGNISDIDELEDFKSYDGFIITPKVKIQMNDVCLAIKANLPVLLQGDTSTGKTSLIIALATKFNKKIIRINNHNQTESSDYIGSYISTKDGIRFNPGPLITAMKKGYWIILDELNLAPSDVLEVLNRLLDDNKELYVPEMDEIIKPHIDFRLFATQNINYGGRQGLAKSFRNRFIEIFFYEKSESDIKEILEKSYSMPSSFTKYMLAIYSALKTERSLNSFITLRDMFKWAKRQPTGYYDLFEIGLDIVYERQRSQEDKNIVVSIFRNVFSERFVYEKKDFISCYFDNNITFLPYININDVEISQFLKLTASNFIMTKSYIKLINLIYKAWKNLEPVLLIGETGIGKTKICEILSMIFNSELKSINIHNGTESSDFVGHPILEQGKITWRNGPLVEALLDGNAFLIDEINLAEDSALERLNSVLESGRSLFIPEISKDIKAADNFRIIATMNPSGDFGKRELSPALRSRFTEIYFNLEPDEYYLIFDSMIDKLALNDDFSNYFKKEFRTLAEISIRKVELVCNHIKNIFANNQKIDDSNCNEIYFLEKIFIKEEIWFEALEILGISNDKEYRYIENDQYFGISPYFLRKKNTVNYSFESKTTRINLQSIIRGITLNKGMLLQGEPGVGKTSIIQSIAKAVNIPVLRINLSDQTEMSDLVGSYLPQGETIKFVESEMIKYIKSGFWVILDEINLCTQSVIEGLNSMLDHRQSIDVDGQRIQVHKNTKIFGTMNPQNKGNGRKNFPKSFLDRFIVISMKNYTMEDINLILLKRYGKTYLFDEKLSLRGNIKFNELECSNPCQFMTATTPITENFENSESSEIKTKYNIYPDKLSAIGSVQFSIHTLPTDYAIISSQLPQIDVFLRCLIKSIPVILNGSVGRNALLKFISTILNLKIRTVDCHKDTDISDLLGQYQKTENTKDNSAIFEWTDSLLIKALREESLIIFNTPELVEKSVFDRLSSLFEAEKSINIHEKGFETFVFANKNSRLVLCCDNPHSLSPALIDRCVFISLPESLLYIDLYKIFISKVVSSQDTTKKFRSCFKDNLFTGMIDTNTVVSCQDLDLEIKKTLAYQKLPIFLNKSIDIINTLNENQIQEMFSLPSQAFIPFNKSHLESYKEISDFAIKLPKTLNETVNSLIKKPYLSTLIKSLFTVASNDFFNCKEIPVNIHTFKVQFLESLKLKTLDEIQQVYYFSQNAHLIPDLKPILFDKEKFFKILTDEDPLNLIKNEILNEKILKENQIKAKISEAAINIYKYGKGNLEMHLKDLENTMSQYNETISFINSRLTRDYGKFMTILKTITFCDYLNNEELRIFLEDFSDLSDYFLLYLFDNREQCFKCCELSNNQLHSTQQCSLRLIRKVFSNSQFYEKLLKPEYSKYLFNQVMKIPQSANNLILESICFNELESNILTDNLTSEILSQCPDLQHTPLEFTNEEINDCIYKLFPQKTKAQIIDKRTVEITIGSDLISIFNFGIHDETFGNQFLPLESIRKMPIFSVPETIINEIHEVRTRNESSINLPLSDEASLFAQTVKKLDQLETSLKALYKKENCLNYERNYSYFQYLMFNEPTIANLENYFMNCNVYEFLDRIFLAEAFLKFKYSRILYNSILIYKSFDIEKMFNQRLHETRIKLFKEPKLYEQTISSFLDKFLYIPVLTVFKINFEIPVNGFECCCNRKSSSKLLNLSINSNETSNSYKNDSRSFYTSLMNQLLSTIADTDCTCDCDKWVKLSKSFARASIIQTFNQETSKEALINLFYSRAPEDQFSYSEICLGKLINNVIFNINSGKYDQETANTCLNLCICAIHLPLPPFMYFSFVFSNTFEDDDQLEEGVGLKTGTGQNNMEDQNIQEDDICDEFDDQKNENIDSEGVDMNNEGDLHSISDQDDAEEGVDPLNNDEGAKESEDNEERGEVGEESNPGVVESFEQPDKEDEEGDEEAFEKSETTENESIEGISETKSDLDANSESLQDSLSENENLDENHESPDLFSYEWKDSVLNQNQTCNASDGYNRKVEGGNLNEKDALKEGEGEEFVEGEGEIDQEGHAFNKTVKFNKISSDCAKLTNLLRIVLESNRSNKYKGDFKSGKKLNLKKIVPYIASDFKKDKIWMKRTKNDKKEYIFRIFIDNSKSMFDQTLIDVLSTIYYQLESSLSLLNIPVQLYKFGSSFKECTVSDLTFDEDRTVIDWTDNFTDGINLILTDGIFQSVGFTKDNFLVLMIDKGNVKGMSKVNVIENKVFIEKYLDSFALKYCIVQKIEDLEKAFIEALSGIIRDIIR